jgi:hypothetical protein
MGELKVLTRFDDGPRTQDAARPETPEPTTATRMVWLSGYAFRGSEDVVQGRS